LHTDENFLQLRTQQTWLTVREGWKHLLTHAPPPFALAHHYEEHQGGPRGSTRGPWSLRREGGCLYGECAVARSSSRGIEGRTPGRRAMPFPEVKSGLGEEIIRFDSSWFSDAREKCFQSPAGSRTASCVDHFLNDSLFRLAVGTGDAWRHCPASPSEEQGSISLEIVFLDQQIRILSVTHS
jgi:hypothetical protein